MRRRKKREHHINCNANKHKCLQLQCGSSAAAVQTKKGRSVGVRARSTGPHFRHTIASPKKSTKQPKWGTINIIHKRHRLLSHSRILDAASTHTKIECQSRAHWGARLRRFAFLLLRLALLFLWGSGQRFELHTVSKPVLSGQEVCPDVLLCLHPGVCQHLQLQCVVQGMLACWVGSACGWDGCKKRGSGIA
jgi:hypothetical protein